jgi:hypothetical protein
MLDFSSGFIKKLLEAAPDRVLFPGAPCAARIAYKLGVAVVQGGIVGSAIIRRFKGSHSAANDACMPRGLDKPAPPSAVDGVFDVETALATQNGDDTSGIQRLTTWRAMLTHFAKVREGV